MKDRLLKNETIFNLITGILTFVMQVGINFFLSPYIVKTLGEAANGFTQLANNFVSYASLITLAFNSMGGRFMTVHYHRHDLKKTNEYFSSICMCNSVIIALMITACIWIIAKLDTIINLGNSNATDVRLLFCCVFINYFAGLVMSIYNMSMFVTNRIYIVNIVNAFRNVLNAIILFVLFSVLPAKMYYVSLSAMILSLASIPIFRKLQRRTLPEVVFDRKLFSFSAIGELLKSGLWNTLNQCGNMLMTGLDLLLANWFVSPVAMGVLSVSKTIPTAITSLAGVLNTSFAPSLTINWAKGNKDETIRTLRQSMKISSVMISLPVVLFCVYGVSFYRLWQPSLNPSQLSVLSILTMAALIPFSGTQVLYNVFTSTNRLKWNSTTFLICGFLNTGIVYVLLKNTSLGVYAIAGTSSIVNIIRNLIFVLPYAAHLLGARWFIFYREVTLSLLYGVCVVIVSSVSQLIIAPNTWITLVLSLILAGTASLGITWFVFLNKNERDMLKRKVVKR